MKLSDIYGREVLGSDGKKRGWVRGILGKGGTPQFLQCFDEDDREFDIDVNDVEKFGEKIIFSDRAHLKSQCSRLRLGLPAYSAAGRFLGNLNDIVSNRRGVHYIIGKKRYGAENICVGDAVIVSEPRTLKDDVLSEGTVIIKKGAPLTADALKKAEEAGEYFQAQMKTI